MTGDRGLRPESAVQRADDAPSEAVSGGGGEDVGYQRVLLAVVMLAVMTFGSLMTIVTVSLDLIAEDLDSSRATLTWMITGLMLAMAVATPIAGKLGDIRGHRRLFLLGLFGGLVTTLASALAWDATSMIVLRVLFGLTGAMMMPSGMALMMHAYAADRRATAMGWYQFAMTGAPTIGLVAGGPLIGVIGWRALFVGFAGITALALVLGYRVLRPTPRSEGVPLDYQGAATLGAAVLSGLLAITRFTELARTESPGRAVLDIGLLGLVAMCVIGIVAFIAIERRSAAPMLQLSYFGRRNFTLPMLSAALVQFAYMGGFVVTPALLGSQYGLAVGAVALVLVPRPGVFSLASPIGGYLATRIGEKKPILFGAMAMVASMIAFAVASLVDVSNGRALGLSIIVVGLALSGAAAGISQPSVAAMVAGSVDEADIGIANGMSQQLMFVGIVTGIQTMNVLAGDAASPARFAVTFGVGLAAAVLGLVAALGASELGSSEVARSPSSDSAGN
jgi:MFS family permease